jgi:hypothetical protein
LGTSIEGPAAVQNPFTTVILRPGDVATLTDGGDLLIDVAADGVTNEGPRGQP